MLSARDALYDRLRPLCGFGEHGDQVAEAIMRLFRVVERRDQEVDVTSLGATHAELYRQTWIVAALADGPTQLVKGQPLGVMESFGRPNLDDLVDPLDLGKRL